MEILTVRIKSTTRAKLLKCELPHFDANESYGMRAYKIAVNSTTRPALVRLYAESGQVMIIDDLTVDINYALHVHMLPLVLKT